MAGRRRKQLHRYPRQREAPQTTHRAIRSLRRPDLPPPRLPRHHRDAAVARSGADVSRRHVRRQTRRRHRRPARPERIRRPLGDEVGRAPADSQRRPAGADEHQVGAAILRLARSRDHPKRAGRRHGEKTTHRHGPELRGARSQFLQDRARHAQTLGECRAGLHGRARPVHPVPQPPLRPLDDE